MRFLITLSLIFTACLLNAQVVTVQDNVTLKPLPDATITSATSDKVLITDEKGKVDISEFRGSDLLQVRSLGYETKVFSYQALESNDFKILMQQDQIPLDEVLVSAVKWNQTTRQMPNKVSVIRPVDITLQNPQTAADLLASSGEVYIQKSQLGGGSPMIRGFATNRLVITVDGVRMNTAIFRSGNIQNVISVDPFAVERTEVVFGPGSVIYGSDAIGGVMNFFTLQPKLSNNYKPYITGSGGVRWASASMEKTGHFDVNIGLNKWAFLTSISYTDFDHLRMGSHGPDEYLRQEYATRINGRDTILPNHDPEVQIPSGYSQLNLMQKILFAPKDNWEISYGFHYSATSDVPRYDRLIEYRNGKLRDAEWYYGPQVWMMNNLNLEHSTKATLFDRIRLVLAHQHFEESRHSRSFGSEKLTSRYETVNLISANLDFQKDFDDRHSLYYGVEGVFNTVGSEAEMENIETAQKEKASTRYPDGSTWNALAAYFNYRFSVSEKLTLQAGSRFSYIMARAEFDTTFIPLPVATAEMNTGSLNGSAGMAYRPAETWQINVNLSTGFRAPNIDDIGKVFDSEPGAVVIPNPHLRPEYAYNAEAGISKVFSDKVKIDITGYYTFLDDALVRRDFQLNGQDSILYDGTLSRVQAVQNAASAYVAGVQAGVEIKLPKGFGLSSHFNYQKGEEELDDGTVAPLRHAGPWFGATHLTYTRDKFKADLYSIYNGGVRYEQMAPSEKGKAHMFALDESGYPYSPTWYTLNLKVMYHVLEHVLVSGGVENITDQRYRPYASGIAAPGRSFIILVRGEF